MIKQTFLQNILNGKDQEGVEFIIVDYNSKDGTDYWVKENLNEYILSGTLNYYKTFEPVTWDSSHAKNIAIRLAKGNVLFIIPAPKLLNSEELYLNRNDLLKINGFNEQITDEEIQYTDLLNRLKYINVNHLRTVNKLNLKTDLANIADTLSVFKIFIKHRTPAVSELIILYNDERYYRAKLLNLLNENADNSNLAYKKTTLAVEYTIAEPGWEKGKWRKTNNETIHFTPRNKNEYILLKSHNQYAFLKDINNEMFYAIHDPGLIQAILEFNDMHYDKLVMEKNHKYKTAIANADGFGKATVFKNFLWKQPIVL